MCGIIGYTGSEDVREVLLDALELLEYRGYDSAGIALRDEESGKTEVRKCAGRVSDLRAICASEKVVSQCGIGHTRWATHGGVNDCNAHPHQVGKVTLVHNGIIENYRELIADYDLADTLKSETDSEVVAHCIVSCSIERNMYQQCRTQQANSSFPPEFSCIFMCKFPSIHIYH